MSDVRLRFAPSPTGGLHLGGVRTVLYNYLFAKKHKGKFIVRTEDTDQERYVEGAEKYIFECLEWCGLLADESALHGGPFAPYRQSERKEVYRKYAEQLIKEGYAYYAFDTPAEIEAMREQLKEAGSGSLQYDHSVRGRMNNSVNLLPEETQKLLDSGMKYVIRIKMIPGESITFTDMIRGEMHFDSNNVDDKVLLKADGMPTYHLAVVVDDHLMQITHAFRGEEWLPSTPVHILLWKYLFGIDKMPQWAHLPLILKPDGNGKLSKRDGDRLGFPVYAMDWEDPKTGEVIRGFKELGFLPEAFINLLAVLGWNDGSEQEIYTLDELIENFSIERVHKSGAKFDFEKAKWFNHEWIKRVKPERLRLEAKEIFRKNGLDITNETYLDKVIELIRDRCILLTDFRDQGQIFFKGPDHYDVASVRPKWDEGKRNFFKQINGAFEGLPVWNIETIEASFKKLSGEMNIKAGELQMILRIMLVGSKTGPGVFAIADILEKKETIKRIQNAISVFG